jgi:hypothetical protein
VPFEKFRKVTHVSSDMRLRVMDCVWSETTC